MFTLPVFLAVRLSMVVRAIMIQIPIKVQKSSRSKKKVTLQK